jgi:hypothetical protein
MHTVPDSPPSIVDNPVYIAAIALGAGPGPAVGVRQAQAAAIHRR